MLSKEEIQAIRDRVNRMDKMSDLAISLIALEDVPKLLGALEQAQAENERYRQALEKIAYQHPYDVSYILSSDIARKALEGSE